MSNAVRLVSHSTPSTEIVEQGISNVQELIAFCARVSNPNNQLNNKTSEKLITYLIQNSHWSPLEMASVCIEINTTRDIARQILRHRSFSFQEFSQRYADPIKELTFVFREVRLQDNLNRQNSIETENEELKANWLLQQENIKTVCTNAYKWAIDNGIAKEVARSILPEGLMQSRVYMSGSIRSWIHYIETRTHKSTQKEHREIAFKCLEEIVKVLPGALTFTNPSKLNDVKKNSTNFQKISEWLGL